MSFAQVFKEAKRPPLVLLFNVVCIHKRYLKCVAPLAAPAAGTCGETPRLCEKPAHGRAVGGYSFHGASPGRTCFFRKKAWAGP